MHSLTSNWKTKLVDKYRNLNFFESEENDAESIRRQRLSTRIYLILLSIFLIILIMYALLLSRTTMVTIRKPSEEQFRQLNTIYPDTLTCPCSQVTARYEKFVNIQVRFHEVCYSVFSSQQFIDTVYAGNVSFISPVHVRTIMSSFWQLIRSFCDLAQKTWIDSYTNLNSTLLISLTARSEFFIKTEVEKSLNFSLATAVSNFKRNLRIVHETTLANEWVSGLATNYYFRSTPNERYINIVPNVFEDGCMCSNVNGCLRPALLVESNDTMNPIKVPGMMFSCLPLDGVLSSTLECFYDSWCLSLLQQQFASGTTPQALHLASHFLHNTTLEILLDELMIEHLATTVSFFLYFTQCYPNYCTYSDTRRFNLLFTISLVASAFGGLSTVLRLLAKLIPKILIKIQLWKRRTNSSNVVDHQPSALNSK